MRARLVTFAGVSLLVSAIACSTPAAIGCPSTQVVCGDACANLARDAKNCGACGHACPLGASCFAGVCNAASACDAGTTLCPDGQCRDTCGTQGCTSPLTSCGGACVDTSADPLHCGGCGTACPAGFAPSQAWAGDSSSPSAQVAVAAGAAPESEVFTYGDTSDDVSAPPGQAFTFHAPSTGGGSFAFDWVYEGDHGPSQGLAGLLAGGAPPPAPPVTLQGPTPTAGPFKFSGTATLTVTAGTDIVFQAIGGAPAASASFGGKITVTGKRCAAGACEPTH